MDSCEIAIAELANDMGYLSDLFPQARIDQLALAIESRSVALGSRPQRLQHDKPDRAKPADGDEKENSARSDPGLLKRIGTGRTNDVQA